MLLPNKLLVVGFSTPVNVKVLSVHLIYELMCLKLQHLYLLNQETRISKYLRKINATNKLQLPIEILYHKITLNLLI